MKAKEVQHIAFQSNAIYNINKKMLENIKKITKFDVYLFFMLNLHASMKNKSCLKYVCT